MRKSYERYKEALIGQIFGRLTAIRVEKTDTQKRGYWLCRCSCGKEKIVRRDGLLDGRVKSCGCLNRDVIRKIAGPLVDTALPRVLNKYKYGAAKRNIKFNLSLENIKFIVFKNCYYCGSPPENIITRPRINDTMLYNGIDRVDNTKGYTLENCVPCCWKCNQAKHIMSNEEFLSWIKKVYEHNFKEG